MKSANHGKPWSVKDQRRALTLLESRPLEKVAELLGRTAKSLQRWLLKEGYRTRQACVTWSQASRDTMWSWHQIRDAATRLNLGFKGGNRHYLREWEVEKISQWLAETQAERLTYSDETRAKWSRAVKRIWASRPERTMWSPDMQYGCSTLIRFEVRQRGKVPRACWLMTCAETKRDRWVSVTDMVAQRSFLCKSCASKKRHAEGRMYSIGEWQKKQGINRRSLSDARA